MIKRKVIKILYMKDEDVKMVEMLMATNQNK